VDGVRGPGRTAHDCQKTESQQNSEHGRIHCAIFSVLSGPIAAPATI
jgi:hypothetical protein